MSRAERITVDAGMVAVGRPKPPHLTSLGLAVERALPLASHLEPLFPGGGLRRGTTVVVAAGADAAQGATSLALALAAQASATRSWCAAIAFPELGLVAAAELGVDLTRLALIPHVPTSQWTNVVGALVDAVDLVLVRPPAHLRQGDARRLTARARERGAVLIPVLGRSEIGRGPWAEGADIRLRIVSTTWDGPGAGEGQLQHREVVVAAGGRGAAARERMVSLALPGMVRSATTDAFTPSVQPTTTDAFAGSDAALIPDPGLAPSPTLRSAG